MPLQVIQLRPGIQRESTTYAAEGGWYACDKIRFRSGAPEKIGGWTIQGSGTYVGQCRSLTDWVSLSGYNLLGIGTSEKYYIMSATSYFDITPIRASSTISTDPFQPMYSTLAASISATDTSFDVVSGTSFAYASPIVVRIGSEKIYVTSVSGNTFVNCVRGYEGTTAAAHTIGDVVDSSQVSVHSISNAAQLGDYVTFSGATAFGPYSLSTLNAERQVFGASANYVIVDLGVYSTSTTVGGGAAVVAAYQISVGNSTATTGNGWGVDVWQGQPLAAGSTTLSADITDSDTTINVVSTATFPASGYFIIESEVIQYAGKTGTSFTGCTRSTDNATSHGTGVTVQQINYTSAYTRGWGTGASTGISQALRLWSADTFGQNLVLNLRDGPVYYWDASTYLSASGSVTGRAVNIVDLPSVDADAPVVGARVIVSDQRHIVVLGANDPYAANPTAQDPMLVRWCDQENQLVWIPTVTNAAGSQRLSHGSRLITAEKTRQEILIWSDSALYSMQFLGPPYTFGFNTLSAEITIASPNAVATANGITYWMGINKFYAYSGRVDTLPCTLRQYVFDDFNTAQMEQVYAGTNEQFNEIIWFYCSSSSSEIDRYVIYNYLERIWYYGTLSRTAWFDSHVRGYPVAASNGVIYYHESGIDDGSTNPPSAIEAYIESADFDIGEGEQFAFIKRIIPDVDFIGSTNTTPSVDFDISVRNYPGQGGFTHTTAAPTSASRASIQVYNYTNEVWTRLRGRHMAIRIASNTVGTQWALGQARLEIQPDGRR